MGIFFGVSAYFLYIWLRMLKSIFDSNLDVKFMLLGPPLAPITGGILATYASWRVMQLSLGVFGFLLFILVFRYLPETIHPGTKGIDLNSVPKSFSMTPGKILKSIKTEEVFNWCTDSDWKWVWLSPFAPFSLAKGRVVLLVVRTIIYVCQIDF